MTKLRVLALTTSYPLRPGASAGVFVQHLYRHLAASWSIEVVCPADSKVVASGFDDDSGADIHVHAVRYAPKSWRTLAQGSGGVVSSIRSAPWRALLVPALLAGLFWRCLAGAGKADLLHANWAISGIVAVGAGWLRGKPVVTTLRGSDVARARRSRLDRVILGFAVQYSRTVICVSQAMADQLRKSFPRRAADIHACLNGVDEAFFRMERPKESTAQVRVLAAGNLIRLKGFDVLIEAVARAGQHQDMMVSIVGEGPEREALQALAARLGVASRIQFVGAVPATGMPERYAEADLLVLSSRSEGRPNVVMEALASGLPVISTDLEGVRGMVVDGDNGWLVPADDVEGLADALDGAVSDRAELRRRGERARADAQARIETWVDTARCYDALFRAATGSRAAAFPPCAE